MNSFKMAAVLSIAMSPTLAGCGLFSKGEPLTPRYFSPEPRVEAAPSKPGPVPNVELRLGNVDSAAYLEERIAYRPRPSELGYYEDRRWTEPPSAYLRRSLSRELFERRGLARIVSGVGPTLDVELVSFEEIRGAPAHARVALHFSLRDERRALLERTIVVEESLTSDPKDPDGAARLTAAMAKALASAVSQVADQTTAALETSPRLGSR
jgi:cholesterol transport system auxiliary component